MTVPKLRFKEFDGNWSLNKLKQLTDVLKCGVASTPTYVDEGGYPFLSAQNVSRDGLMNYSKVNHISAEFYKKISKTKLLKGDILYSRVGASYGVASIFDKDEEYGVYVSLTHIRANKCLDNVFLKLFLNSPKARVQAERGVFQGGGVQNLNVGVVEEFELSIPSKEEQTKVAFFLSAVDEKISQLTQKHELLSQYKQGMMQKLFSQQIRFKADDGNEFGEWEEKTLNEIASKQSNKNKDDSITEVLTNSATQGIIKQSDYFDREIVTESNLNGYYIVNLNDFVYNPRISVHAPVGPIKRNKKCLGVMSPLYTVFTVKEGDLTYLEYFFDSNFWHDYVKSVANSGARHDRMNITNKDFFDMPILYPCCEEQTKIANFLSAIDQKIDVVAQQIEQAKMWKKGLLQQMFV
ncbi:restriction endonuclease subunit S [Acinetobacter courvalinii]|uniref:Restriction endonuclease subunit S n=1 Tax=Acinetobacter courvalinii TaxID=280147 RepID=A0AA42I9Z8_9GAMM|nr:restriction endonuclease subunit S [Acinetobacter courvalinii]MBJ9956629.1 restriction endonuclease subunit S [Acinetobacter courvalinii]MDH0564132.1 restriction endonuclease subunit S [Acinetobacter courvalinii]